MMDSFAVFRCRKKVFERSYAHDYAKIYGREAGEQGPRRTACGQYNYFDSYCTPLITARICTPVQSVSKTVTSVIVGAAVQRGDFKAGLDTPT